MTTTTLQETLDAAKRAIAAGRLDEAELLKRRAQAMKAGTLAEFEAQADLTAQAMLALPHLREAKRANAMANVKTVAAYKALINDILDPGTVKLADELHGGDYADLAWRKQQATRRYIMSGRIEDDEAAHAVVLSPEALTEFVTLGMGGAEIKATMVESVSGLGGFILGGDVAERVMARATTIAIVRSRATVEVPNQDGNTGIPIVQGSGDVYSSALRGFWSSETQAGIAENFTLGISKPEVNLWRLPIYVSKSLLEDAGPRLLTLIARLAGDAVGMAEDAAFLAGAGAGRPLGIIAQTTDGNFNLLNKDIRVTTSAGVGTISADDVVNTIFSLPATYRLAPTSCVTFNSSTAKVLYRMKDGSGRYLFEPEDNKLLGVPVNESENMPSIASGAVPLLVGDFSGYGIIDRLAMAIQRFDDSSVAAQDQVLLHIRRRIAGSPIEGYRWACLRVQ